MTRVFKGRHGRRVFEVLSKQEIIKYSAKPIYRVWVRLLYYPYTTSKDVNIVGGKKIDRHEHSIHFELFDYIHTQESIRRDLFGKGYTECYLQVRSDGVYAVSGELPDGLGRAEDRWTETITMFVTNQGIYI